VFRVEWGKAMHRARTYVLAGGLALLAILPVVVLAATHGSGSGGGPPFFDQIRHSGMIASIAAVALIQPFFLPLGTGLLAGETMAWEAANGTLRYLVVRPVGRARLILSKYAAVLTQLAAAIGWIALVGLVAGLIAFGTGPLPTLSGTTLSTGPALVRILVAAAYVLLGVTSVAAIGVFLSTLTESSPAAIIATVALALTSQVLDNIAVLHAVHPYLFTHHWLAFVDLFRSPVEWSGMIRGLVLDGIYTALFLGGAVAVFSRKDVVS